MSSDDTENMTTSKMAELTAIRLARSAHLAGRPGVVVVERDLAGLRDLTGHDRASLALINRLEKAGRLQRVRRGAYVIISPTGTVELDSLDLVSALTELPYLVTAGKALQFHDLTDQHFHRICVAVATQRRSWSWRGEEVTYVRVKAGRLKTATTRTSRTRARIALPARAIIDSLAHPQWGVTLSQVVEAIERLMDRDESSTDSLALEAASLGSSTTARRAGFLVARIAGRDAARPFLPLLGQSKAVTPLRPGVAGEGPIDSEWRIRENIPFERLSQHRVIG